MRSLGFPNTEFSKLPLLLKETCGAGQPGNGEPSNSSFEYPSAKAAVDIYDVYCFSMQGTDTVIGGETILDIGTQ